MGVAGLQIVEVGVDTVAFALESTLGEFMCQIQSISPSRLTENKMMLNRYILPETVVDSMQRHQFAIKGTFNIILGLNIFNLIHSGLYLCGVLRKAGLRIVRSSVSGLLIISRVTLL
ncbi:hypothetical protein K450DRAFT_231832 [Umbelopsis ramanniana AG]|uniref:Uncharacterized protein n=1 Tax=Umbelopsis ramanniana AG TaxID=1314678 RepID=A0AAD5EEN4_UMBRA|nr:uncharacterized protein K450DRAFT_231832 [Umbelopsis ramanniana AG]KAI8581546.1 hypothetical protein K450DRAFT_231832 [Umbelopsis ramanniana AG]